jgi:hypothetical protein
MPELSQTYKLASREMSLVAVVKRAGDRPGELPETRVVPVGMPQDTAFSSYFSRDILASSFGQMSRVRGHSFQAHFAYTDEPTVILSGPLFQRNAIAAERSQTAKPTVDLTGLAAELEPDGGMPGDTIGVRVARTIAAIFACG